MNSWRFVLAAICAASVLFLAPSASGAFDAEKLAAPRALCQTHGEFSEGGWRAPLSRGYTCVVDPAENGLVGEFTDEGVVLYVESDPRAQASMRLCEKMGGDWLWFDVPGPSQTGEYYIGYGGYSCIVY
jgi:hypothetical protein